MKNRVRASIESNTTHSLCHSERIVVGDSEAASHQDSFRTAGTRKLFAGWTRRKARAFAHSGEITFLLITFWLGQARAQLSAANIAEFQAGNLPYTAPADLATLYDQLNLSYQFRVLRAAARFEFFQRSGTDSDYSEITQRALRFGKDRLSFTAGNFYEIFGRGLLLRTYEIPGTILEDLGLRTRYGFYRDVDGFLLKYQTPLIEVKALRGRPLFNMLPPTFSYSDRHPNLLQGMETNIRFLQGWSAGGSYLRNSRDDQVSRYSTVFVSGNVSSAIQFYSEFAQQLGGGYELFDFSDRSAHAFYAGANYASGPFGLSLEGKDYNDFTLFFNDPPPLVREHSYIVLNRSTHILQPRNETGWQAEAFLRAGPGHTLTANATRAENNFGSKTVFQEYFAEFEYLLDDQMSIKAFADRSEDPFNLEENRNAAGLYVQKEWQNNWGTILDVDSQEFERSLSPVQQVRNCYAAFTLARAPKFSAAVIWENTTDPLLTDDPRTETVETGARHWLAGTFSYQSRRQLVSMFYGKRRGGPACTSGICYEVLDFEGFEMRVTSNF
jgi:hypothetical protein